VVIFQHTLFVAEMWGERPMIGYAARKIARGASEFQKLGQEARCQSVRKELEYLERGVNEFMKKQGLAAAKPSQRTDIAWCNYKLTSVDREQFGRWEFEANDIASALTQMVSEGYRFSVSWDRYNKAIQVTCIAPEEPCVNAGKGFSTFAADWEKLWALVVWKHFSLFQQTWPEVQAPTSPESFG
jgi:hypothetical protein